MCPCPPPCARLCACAESPAPPGVAGRGLPPPGGAPLQARGGGVVGHAPRSSAAEGLGGAGGKREEKQRINKFLNRNTRTSRACSASSPCPWPRWGGRGGCGGTRGCGGAVPAVGWLWWCRPPLSRPHGHVRTRQHHILGQRLGTAQNFLTPDTIQRVRTIRHPLTAAETPAPGTVAETLAASIAAHLCVFLTKITARTELHPPKAISSQTYERRSREALRALLDRCGLPPGISR